MQKATFQELCVAQGHQNESRPLGGEVRGDRCVEVGNSRLPLVGRESVWSWKVDHWGCVNTSKQNVLIMGKRTWFSIPEKNRPLKDRINIVLSRELKETPKGAHYLAKSLDDALVLLDSPELKSKIDMVWIIGGSSIYKAAMEKPVHQRLFVTRILHEFESDTFFPEIDLEKYKHLPEYPGVPADVQEENGIRYKYEVYEKTV
nr:dihydrofolate reductase isoform X1 [Chrysemys picta bellii]